MIVVVLVVALLAGAIAATVTWSIVRHDRPAPSGAGEALDGDPTPVPAAPTSGPTWSAVVDRIPLGVVVMSSDGQVLYRNSSAKAVAGTYTGLLIDDAIQSALRQALDGRPSSELLELYGPPRIAVVVTAEGLQGGSAVATIEDVSERRRVDAMRTDFVANISHELKTPVGALAVLAEALADESDPDVVRRVSERMVAESHRVARTIDDLMELSRIELGEETVRDTVEVVDIVSGAVDRSAALAETRDIHIAVLDLPDGVSVVGDRRQLISALGNLVENAVKYSERGGHVQIRVRVEGRFAELMVADQGIGIPAADHDRIFERFYRVDKGRGRDTGGTGLGLAIVRHIATNHGGEVLVSSAEGEGSTFVIRLPLAKAKAPDRSVGPGPQSRHRLIRRGERVSVQTVLVVEDEASFVEALTLGLRREGFRVEVATDGIEALERFDSVRPDLVLLDVMLPRVSGIDVCRQLRKKSQVPIIMVTAKGAEIDTVVGLEVGADDYITKPYRLRELVARMRAVLRRSTGDPAGELGPAAIEVGDVVLDPDEHVVTVAGEIVALPLKEFELLHVLIANAGRVLPRETLIDRVWGNDYVGDTKTLDVHVKRLRSKIEPNPAAPGRIVTIRGLGYKYERS